MVEIPNARGEEFAVYCRSEDMGCDVATIITPTSARSARGSWIVSRGEGRPARMRLIEASVRSRCACHSASATGSCVANVSVSAVAGRWRMPVLRSSRLKAASRLGPDENHLFAARIEFGDRRECQHGPRN